MNLVKHVVFLDASTIFLAAADGRFIKSEDRGETWSVVGRLSGSPTRHSWSSRQLVLGAEGSLWGLYDQQRLYDPLGSTVAGLSEFALSTDGGESFQRIKPSVDTPFTWDALDLIPCDGDDPLILAESASVQLWEYLDGSGDTQGTMQPVGVPDPAGEAFFAVICEGVFFVTSTKPGKIWRSVDTGLTWSEALELTQMERIRDFACGSGGALWALTETGRVFQLDRDLGVFEEVIALREVDARFTGVSATSDGALAYFAGHDDPYFEAEPGTAGTIVLRLAPDGSATRLVGPGHLVRELKVDPAGALWARESQGLFRWDEETTSWVQSWPPPDPT